MQTQVCYILWIQCLYVYFNMTKNQNRGEKTFKRVENNTYTHSK